MRRRPPFALVLVAFVAALGATIALLSGGSGGHPDKDATAPASGPVEACVTARAEAAATAAETLSAPVEARVPVSVTEHGGGASVTASQDVVEHAVATRSIEVRRGAVAKSTACAQAATRDAARSHALTRAYKKALVEARARARITAAETLRTYADSELPALAASAQRQIDARAESAAATVRLALAAQARARLP